MTPELGAAVLAGLVVGGLLAALGGGGSILTVPVLVYLLGQDPHEAAAGSLLVVSAAALAGLGAHVRGGRVDARRGTVFALVAVPGSLLGALVGARLPSDVLMLAFAALLLTVAGLMLRRLRRRPGDDGPTSPPAAAPDPAKVLLSGSGAGALTGMLGVGGGFVVVPALNLAVGLAMPVAVGTSLLVLTVTSASALAVHAVSGIHLDWAVVAPFMLAAATGAVLGGRLASVISERALALGFALLLVAVSLFVLVRTLVG